MTGVILAFVAGWVGGLTLFIWARTLEEPGAPEWLTHIRRQTIRLGITITAVFTVFAMVLAAVDWRLS